MKKNKIISLCDLSGNALKPWAEAGYECLAIDTQTSIRATKKRGGIKKNGITYIWGDVRQWWPDTFEDVAGVFAWPPCTHLTSSGSQDWKQKGMQYLIDALTLVESCRKIQAAAEAHGAFTMLENPVGRLGTLWRKYDHKFDPHQYAGYLENETQRNNEAYTKGTCLWVSKNFVMPPQKSVEPVLGTKMHKLPPGPKRANLRSETPKGFSLAVFLYNSQKL